MPNAIHLDLLARGTVVIVATPSPPAAPSALNAVAISATRVDLSWTDNASDEVEFEIERAPAGSGTWAALDTAAEDATSYSDTTVVAETAYDFRVRAVNADGNSAWSNTASATTPAAGASEVKVLPGLVAAAKTKATANTAQWQAFKAARDAELGQAISATYQGSHMASACDFALAYRCVKDTNPTLATDYAGKALGLVLSGVREFISSAGSEYGAWQYIGRGDGSTTTFTLPGAPLAGTLSVRSATVKHTATTRSATYDEDTFLLYEHVIKVANTSDGAPAYTEGVDWWHGAKAFDNYLSWQGGASKPSNGATYYITSASPYGAGAVASGNYGTSGDQITFNTAPAANQAIFVKHAYHVPGGLRYQQTHGDQGGYSSIFNDSGYTARNLMWVAIARDWLDDFAGFTSALKAEVDAQLVQWFDAITAGSDNFGGTLWAVYANTNANTNYGTGHYQYKLATALALDGRHASAAALKTNVLDWRTANLLPAFNPPSNGRTTLADGHYLEGAHYGPESAHMIARTVPMIAQSGWATPTEERAWVAGTIRSLLHQQPTRTTFYSGGHGGTVPMPVPAKDKWVAWSAGTTDAKAVGHANWHIQTGVGSTFTDHEDLLFRDPNATPDDPTDGDEPLYRGHRGSGHIFGREAWDYTSEWFALDLQKIAGGGHEPGTFGGLYINRGADILLIDAATKGGSQANAQRHAWGSVVVVDDSGQGLQYNRWNAGPWAGDPGPIATWELTSTYAWASCDYKSVFSSPYSPGAGGPLVELEREVLHVQGWGFAVFDRAETTQAGHQKQLRWSLGSTTAAVTGGTWTIAHGGNTTAALAYNAPAATVQAALEALPSIGAGNVTVTLGGEVGSEPTASPVGQYKVAFVGALAGSTQSLLAVDASGLTTAGGGAPRARVQDVHQYLIAGTSLTQLIYLGEDSATDTFQVAAGSSKLFGQVYSESTLDTGYELMGVSYAGALARRATSQNATPAASVRYLTLLQTTDSGVASMDADREHIVGTGGQLQGARRGNVLALFRKPRLGFALPETYGYTAPSGTTTHYIAGLSPSTTYEYSGSASGTATSSAAGVLVFTTTGPGAQTITLAVHVPIAPEAPSNVTATALDALTVSITWTDNSTTETGFEVARSPQGAGTWATLGTTAASATSFTDGTVAAGTAYDYRVRARGATADSAWVASNSVTTPAATSASFAFSYADVGISTDVQDWYDEGGAWWFWEIIVHDWDGGAYTSVLIVHHYSTKGVRYYKNTLSTPGGTPAFTNVTTDPLGKVASDLGGAPGQIVSFDIDGDGQAEHGCRGAGTMTNKFWRVTGGVLVDTGVQCPYDSNYVDKLTDLDGDGQVDIVASAWPSPAALTALSDATVHYARWNGSGYTKTSEPFALPAGVPAAVAADCLARLQATVGEGKLFTLYLDVNDDGTDELVIMGACAYDSASNFTYFLQDNGDGTYTDRTADWGLPREGTFLPIQPYWKIDFPRWVDGHNHLHQSLDGAGTPHLFFANDTATAGTYKWNGTSYDHVADIITTTLQLPHTNNESYLPQLYALDLTNKGRLDLVYHSPRSGYGIVFTNDGSGTFSRVDGPNPTTDAFLTGDPYCLTIADFDNDGSLEIMLGQTDPATGAAGPRKVALLNNDTTGTVGRWLKVKLRRSTTDNPFGVGGMVEIYKPGTAFAASGLLRRFTAPANGQPLHFGCDARTKVDLKVTWPDGAASTQTNVDTNQTITVTE